MLIKLVLTAAATLSIATATTAFAQTPTPAMPEPDPLAGFYGNTLLIQLKGYKATRVFEPDHTYRDLVRGKPFPGAWSVEGDRICTQSPGFNKYCNLGLDKAPGDTWLDKDPYTGNEVRFTLVPGRKADR